MWIDIIELLGKHTRRRLSYYYTNSVPVAPELLNGHQPAYGQRGGSGGSGGCRLHTIFF